MSLTSRILQPNAWIEPIERTIESLQLDNLLAVRVALGVLPLDTQRFLSLFGALTTCAGAIDGVGVTEGKRVAWIDSMPAATRRIELAWRQDRAAAETIEISVRAGSEQERTWLRDLERFRKATSSTDESSLS